MVIKERALPISQHSSSLWTRGFSTPAKRAGLSGCVPIERTSSTWNQLRWARLQEIRHLNKSLSLAVQPKRQEWSYKIREKSFSDTDWMVGRKRTATYSRQALFWDSVLPSWQGRASALERWDEPRIVIESGEQDDKSVPSPVIPIRIVVAGIPFGIFFSCEISSELAKNSHIVETRECVWKWGEWVCQWEAGSINPKRPELALTTDDWLITCAAKRRF